ncbi:hypothetical protein ACPWSR_16895 [Alloiococcus sp. CFN-8]|uniref:hypothetical protein n=1 Tax=Alloiococcus sp. CFN-8 TaxID=3416081 RepID=UPI003CE9E56D
MKYLPKFISLTIIFIILISAGLPVLYFATYQLINHTDTSIYTRYATDNKYEEDIFFNEKVEENTGILTELKENIDEMGTIKSKQDFARVLSVNKDKVEQIINGNSKYKKYLSDQGSSVNELLEWSKKTAELDDNILQLSLFLICIIFAGTTVIIFKCRKTFYFIAGIIYTITIMSMFSGGISDYLVLKAMNVFLSLGRQTLSYQDMDTIKTIFIQAYKESMVAFIIFDTIIQLFQGDMERKRKEEIQYIIYTLDYQINFLEKYKDDDYKYTTRLRIPVTTLLKQCLKKQKSLERNFNKAGKNAFNNSRITNEKNNIDKLISYINKIINFNEARTTREYIGILTEIRILMYVLHIYGD